MMPKKQRTLDISSNLDHFIGESNEGEGINMYKVAGKLFYPQPIISREKEPFNTISTHIAGHRLL